MGFRNLLQKTKRKVIKEQDEIERQWGKKEQMIKLMKIE